ncbi:MAG: Gfo/Idh/MocA family protein [Phycisphaerae bacterium]
MAADSDRPLGVAILGFGFIGRVHAYAHANLPFFYDPPPLRTRLVGVATGHRETADRARSQFGFDVATTDQLSLINRDDVHIVHICTPNHLHLPALLAAIRAGKHIYCDKPLTATVDEAEQVASALAGYRGTSQMTLQNRFIPATLRAKQLIDESRIGAVTHFRAAFLHSGSVDRTRPLSWKGDLNKGGGVITDLLSHVVDLVWHLLGPLEVVHAVQRVWSPQRPCAEEPGRAIRDVAEDFAMAIVRTGDGAPGVIEASKIATGTEDELRLEIHGERGALRFNLMDANWLDFYDRTAPDSPIGGEAGWKRIATVNRYPAPARFPGPRATPGWLRAHVECLHNFLSAIARNEPGGPDLAHGVALQRFLGAIKTAATP